MTNSKGRCEILHLIGDIPPWPQWSNIMGLFSIFAEGCWESSICHLCFKECWWNFIPMAIHACIICWSLGPPSPPNDFFTCTPIRPNDRVNFSITIIISLKHDLWLYHSSYVAISHAHRHTLVCVCVFWFITV